MGIVNTRLDQTTFNAQSIFVPECLLKIREGGKKCAYIYNI